jgi:hypothetical protein
MFSKGAAGRAGMFLLLLAFSLSAASQETPPTPPAGAVRTFFTTRSAKPDDSLPEEAREEFEDDDGRPLQAVAIDLNGDGAEEKLFLSGVPSKSGGRQWLVWDTAANAARGLIIGTIIFVERDADDGFARLESYWKQGPEMSVVFDYALTRGKYGRVNSRSLTVPEIDEYFRTKPPIDLDKELAAIQADNETNAKKPS